MISKIFNIHLECFFNIQEFRNIVNNFLLFLIKPRDKFLTYF